MDLAEAIREWVERTAPDQGAPHSITELAEYYGRQQEVTKRNRHRSLVSRGNAAFAKELGVDIRSVQRFERQERGAGGEVRVPEQQTRSRLARIRERVAREYQRNPVKDRKALANHIRRGLQVGQVYGELSYAGYPAEYRRIIPSGGVRIPVSPELDDLASYVELGRWEDAAEAFDRAFMNAYFQLEPDAQPIARFGETVDWIDMEASA